MTPGLQFYGRKTVFQIARDVQSPVEEVRTQAIKRLDRLGGAAVAWLTSAYASERYGGIRRIPFVVASGCCNLTDYLLLAFMAISLLVAPGSSRAILSRCGRWGGRLKAIRLSMLPKCTLLDRGILIAALRYDDVALLEILGDALWCTKGTLRDECQQKVIELLPKTRKEEFARMSVFIRDLYYAFLDYPYIERNTELLEALIEFFARIKDTNAEMFIRSLANDHIVVDVPMSTESRERVVAAAKSAVARWKWPSLESPFPRAKPQPGGSTKR